MAAEANPFGEIEKTVAETLAAQLVIAEALDAMDKDLNTWEAGFLQSVLDQLKIRKRPLTQTQLDMLYKLHDHYGIDRDED